MKKKVCMLGLALSLSMFGLVACGENSEESNQPTVEAGVENNELESVPVQPEENPVDAENADAANTEPATEAVEPTTEAAEPTTEAAEPTTEAVEPTTEASTEEAETTTEEASTTVE